MLPKAEKGSSAEAGGKTLGPGSTGAGDRTGATGGTDSGRRQDLLAAIISLELRTRPRSLSWEARISWRAASPWGSWPTGPESRIEGSSFICFLAILPQLETQPALVHGRKLPGTRRERSGQWTHTRAGPYFWGAKHTWPSRPGIQNTGVALTCGAYPNRGPPLSPTVLAGSRLPRSRDTKQTKAAYVFVFEPGREYPKGR